MVEQGVIVVSSQQRRWEDHSVERNIVFGHELVELDLVRILPPSFPLLGVAGSNGKIPRGWGEENV